MGELPKFITGVPEDSISQQQVQDEPLRTFFSLFETFNVTSGTKTIYTVPKGFVLEIRSMTLSVKSPVPASTVNTYRLSTQPDALGSEISRLYDIVLDHSEHQVITWNFAEFDMLVNENLLLVMRSVTSGGTNWHQLQIFGYLVKKDEIVTKKNIFL